MTDEEKTTEDKQPQKRAKRRPRAHGTGSVFQRKDRKGKQWVAQLILENGKTRQRYFTTQGEAATALNEMLYEQQHGILAAGPNQTVKQFEENCPLVSGHRGVITASHTSGGGPEGCWECMAST